MRGCGEGGGWQEPPRQPTGGRHGGGRDEDERPQRPRAELPPSRSAAGAPARPRARRRIPSSRMPA
eukprot:3036988-Alexandrium_andersonii.AAC.1